MNLSQIKKDIKSIATKDIEKAFKKFESILNSNSSLYNTNILLQGNFNGLKRDKLQGIISSNDANMRQNRIRYAFVSMIDDLEEMDIISETLLKENFITSDTLSVQSMNSNNSDIYISYAWEGESEKIVDLLDKELQTKEIKVIRDKRDLEYKGSIVGFMKDIGKGNSIIVVISKKYLKSENCMFELTQIYENKDFAKRIFPIILEDADIYNPISRVKYIKYWNDKIEKLDQAIKSAGTSLNMTEIQKELNNYGNIRAAFDKMSFILKDMNALTPEMHQNQNFQTLYDQLVS